MPGEVTLIDRHGVAIGRKKFGRYVTAYRAAIYGGLIAGMVLALSGMWLSGALLYSAAAALPYWLRRKGTGELLAIELLARQGELEEAQRRLDAAEQVRRRNPARYARTAGSLASHRGEHAAALGFWRQAMPATKGIEREMLKVSMTQALARNGEIKEARLMSETIEFPPATDPVISGQSLTPIVLALHDPDASALPDVEQLHEWTRRALAYSHTGVELAALGWAFDRRGEGEMAEFCAREAGERMHYKHLATWWPELQQWLDQRRVEA